MSTKPRPLRRSTADRIPARSGDMRERLAARQEVAYTCHRGHTFTVTFFAGIDPPHNWTCRCGKPAGLGTQPATEPQLERRMGQVRQRRTDAELEQMIADRLAQARSQP